MQSFFRSWRLLLFNLLLDRKLSLFQRCRWEICTLVYWFVLEQRVFNWRFVPKIVSRVRHFSADWIGFYQLGDFRSFLFGFICLIWFHFLTLLNLLTFFFCLNVLSVLWCNFLVDIFLVVVIDRLFVIDRFFVAVRTLLFLFRIFALSFRAFFFIWVRWVTFLFSWTFVFIDLVLPVFFQFWILRHCLLSSF